MVAGATNFRIDVARVNGKSPEMGLFYTLKKLLRRSGVMASSPPTHGGTHIIASGDESMLAVALNSPAVRNHGISASYRASNEEFIKVHPAPENPAPVYIEIPGGIESYVAHESAVKLPEKGAIEAIARDINARRRNLISVFMLLSEEGPIRKSDIAALVDDPQYAAVQNALHADIRHFMANGVLRKVNSTKSAAYELNMRSLQLYRAEMVREGLEAILASRTSPLASFKELVEPVQKMIEVPGVSYKLIHSQLYRPSN